MNTYDTLYQFLAQPDNKDLLFDLESIVWIDWREEDETIIDYFNDQLEEKIKVSFINQNKPYGDDIKLTRKEKSLIIPYQDKMTRDLTLTCLSDFLLPDYEIRWVLDSLGSDTLAFVMLEKEAWQRLEKTYGKAKVDFYFLPIKKETVMFDLDIDEVFSHLDKRAKKPPV